MSISDFYMFSFQVDADIEEFSTMFPPARHAMPGRTHGTLRLENRLGGTFEMSTKPNEFGMFMRYDVGEGGKKGNVVQDVIEDANFGRKIAGALETYGDHTPGCEMKDEEWEPEWDEDEPSCTCGFSSMLSLDERNNRRMRGE